MHTQRRKKKTKNKQVKKDDCSHTDVCEIVEM